MICESCNQNLATVHLTEIVQKYKKETHLCEECARERGVPYKANFSVKEFLGGIAGPQPEQAASEPAPAEAPAPRPEGAGEPLGPCPSCGLTLADFRATGRLGCHHDYAHFRASLVPLLEKIHGTSQHTGRFPSRMGQRIERDRLLEGYRKELQRAVQREDYERAAELRDKIRKLENLEGARP